MADDTEGNAEEALKAFGGKVSFDSANHEKGGGWGDTEGNSDEAITAWGGVADGGKSSSILRHSADVEMPSGKDDSPKADTGQGM